MCWSRSEMRNLIDAGKDHMVASFQPSEGAIIKNLRWVNMVSALCIIVLCRPCPVRCNLYCIVFFFPKNQPDYSFCHVNWQCIYCFHLCSLSYFFVLPFSIISPNCSFIYMPLNVNALWVRMEKWPTW